MRQVVLDTETTGLEVEHDHRVIEIGCVELFNRRLTGRSFHRYLNPERDIDEGALEVHGLSREQLAKEPRFVAGSLHGLGPSFNALWIYEQAVHAVLHQFRDAAQVRTNYGSSSGKRLQDHSRACL